MPCAYVAIDKLQPCHSATHCVMLLGGKPCQAECDPRHLSSDSCLSREQLTSSLSTLQSVQPQSVLLQLGLTVISNLAATAEGAALLLKSPLLSKTEQQLHHLLQRRDGLHTAALLRPLVNLAGHGEGQKQIVRATCAPGQTPEHLACKACMQPELLQLRTSCSPRPMG